MIHSRLQYLLLLAGLFAFHIMFIDHLSFFILVFFLLLPCISLLLTFFACRASIVSMSVNVSEVLRGEAVAIRIRARNPSYIPVRTRVEIAVRNELTGREEKETLILMAGRQGGELTQTLSSSNCGKLECRVDKTGVYDLLGLFCFKTKRDNRQSYGVLSMPAALPLAGANTAGQLSHDTENDGKMRVVKGDDPSELYDLRDYMPGDRVTRIHRKLSDKMGKLIVKEYGRVVSNDVLIIMDLNGSSREIDALLTCFRSVSSYLLQNDIPHEAEWYSGKCEWGRRDDIPAAEELHAALSALLTEGRAQAEPFAMLGRSENLSRRRYSKVIYLCAGRGMTEQGILALSSALAGSALRALMVSEDGGNVFTAFGADRGIVIDCVKPADIDLHLKGLTL